MKKIFRKEVLIGALVLVALAVLIFGIDFLKGVNVFKAANYYMVEYTDVQGLTISAPVTVNGYKVGQVREISYQYDNPGHILVEISLDRELKLPKGSKAMLSTDLLGTASIALVLAPGKDFYAVGDMIEGEVPKGLMGEVSENLLPSVSNIFPKVDTLLTTVNTLVSDPAIAASVKRLDAITANLETSTRQLNSLIATLPPVVRNVNTITSNVTSITDNLNATTHNISQLPLDSLVNSLQLTMNNLHQLSQELNNPNSTLGLLMHDPALYRNLNKTVQSLDSLFIDIKANPKRYISIKLL